MTWEKGGRVKFCVIHQGVEKFVFGKHNQVYTLTDDPFKQDTYTTIRPLGDEISIPVCIKKEALCAEEAAMGLTDLIELNREVERLTALLVEWQRQPKSSLLELAEKRIEELENQASLQQATNQFLNNQINNLKAQLLCRDDDEDRIVELNAHIRESDDSLRAVESALEGVTYAGRYADGITALKAANKLARELFEQEKETTSQLRADINQIHEDLNLYIHRIDYIHSITDEGY